MQLPGWRQGELYGYCLKALSGRTSAELTDGDTDLVVHSITRRLHQVMLAIPPPSNLESEPKFATVSVAKWPRLGSSRLFWANRKRFASPVQ